MVRAIGLLIVFVVIELVFGDLHPWEFLAKQMAPPVRRVPTIAPVVNPGPTPPGVSVENPLLKDPQGNINRQMFEFMPDVPAKALPEKK